MNFRDKIRKFNAFALTNATSVYNEDSMTAQQLAITSANKVKECLTMVDELAVAIENIKEFLKINYSEDTEELELTIQSKIDEVRLQVTNTYACMFDEDSMSALELAGQSAKQTNECVKTVNMLCDLVEEINGFISLRYANDEEMLIVGGKEDE